MKEQFLEILDNLKSLDGHRSLKSYNPKGAVTFQEGTKDFISFCSNDYLGLSTNPEVKKAAIAAIDKYGAGGISSRYIIGNNELYQKLESKLADFKNSDDAIIFSSGYSCALGVIPALVQKGDLIIADRLIHSCLIDGSKLSGAKLIRFLHNDIDHARHLLKENSAKYNQCLILTESVFSMDGDLGKVSELLDLAIKYNCLFLCDYAHDLYIDKSNFGINSKYLKLPDNFIQMGTMSKAIGSLGGYIAASGFITDYLRNFAKSQIYSTALPPAILAASIKSLELITSGKDLGKKALENAKYFAKLLSLPDPKSAIIVIITKDNLKTLELAKKVKDEGFLISAIRPPTVQKGKARLRITFSTEHSQDQIKSLADAIKRIVNQP